MKLQTSLLAVIAAFQGAAFAAPIPLTGTMVHNETFDSLGTADVAWVDDSTLPGWLAEINNGTTAAGVVQAADGNTVLSGLLNLGAIDATDRALGSKATGTGAFANIAYGIQFQNTSASPIQLSELGYTGELWRTNTTAAGLAEVFTVFYAISPTMITDIISGGNSAAAAPGAGFTALGAAANWSSPTNLPAGSALDGNDPANRTAVTFAPVPSITVPPGQFLVIKWTDTNLGDTDGFQGIDDLNIDFTAVSGLLTPTLSNFTRNTNGTNADPTDDTFGFTVSVAGAGAVGPGWTTTDVTAPNATSANYGSPVVWTGFPVSAPKTVTFVDSVTPAISNSIAVNPPQIIGTNEIIGVDGAMLSSGAPINGWVIDEVGRTGSLGPSNPTQADFVYESSVIDLSATGFVRFSAELDAIAGGSSGFENADSFALELIIDGGAPVSVLGADDVDVSGRLTGLDDTLGVGPELPGNDEPNITRPFAFDFLIPSAANSVQIRITGNNNSPAETLVLRNMRLAVPSASLFAEQAAAGTFDNKGTASTADDEFSVPVNINPIGLGASTGWTSDEVPPRSGLYATPNPIMFGPYPGRTPVTVILRDNGDPNVTSGPLVLNPPPGNLTATVVAGSVTRIDNNPGPADDTVTFSLNVGATNAGVAFTADVSLLGNPGPASVSGAGNYPAAGTPVTLTLSNVPTSAGTVPVVITDTSYPTNPAPVTVNVVIPAAAVPGIIGRKDFGGGASDVTAGATVPPEWVIYSGTRETIMSAGVAADSVLDSEVIDLTSVGAVSFTAQLVARETSTGSNFETADRFKAELIVNGDDANPISVLPAGTDVGDGAASPAVNGPPNGFINGYTGTPDEADYNTNVDRDEFNTGREVADTALNNVINLSGSVPASADNVLLRIVGAGVTGTEALIVRNVLFSPGAVSNDTDGDGESNTDEGIAGTSPTDPTDVLRLTSNPATPNVISFPTKADRFYRVYVSDDANEPTHLTVWKDAGLGTMTLAGNGNPAQFNITVSPGETRRFYRIHVMQTDGVGGVWPATYP